MPTQRERKWRKKDADGETREKTEKKMPTQEGRREREEGKGETTKEGEKKERQREGERERERKGNGRAEVRKKPRLLTQKKGMGLSWRRKKSTGPLSLSLFLSFSLSLSLLLHCLPVLSHSLPSFKTISLLPSFQISFYTSPSSCPSFSPFVFPKVKRPKRNLPKSVENSKEMPKLNGTVEDFSPQARFPILSHGGKARLPSAWARLPVFTFGPPFLDGGCGFVRASLREEEREREREGEKGREEERGGFSKMLFVLGKGKFSLLQEEANVLFVPLRVD